MIRIGAVRLGGARLRTAVRDKVRLRAVEKLQEADDAASTLPNHEKPDRSDVTES